MLTCKQCGVRFQRLHHKGQVPKWCSPACANRAARRRKNPSNFGPQACAVCGAIFERQWPVKAQKTCSRKCCAILTYQKNRARIDEYTNRWHRAHKERLRGYVKASIAKKPDHYRMIRRLDENRRRAGYVGTFTKTEWLALKSQYGNICLRCLRHESERSLTADHVIPISKGGPNLITNIQPLCQPCNAAKWTRTIDYRPLRDLVA
jgi:5-methylcytosine-specific restriction endonuclease McrA